jgi:hypothetical protein
MNERERLDLMYRIGYLDGKIDAAQERIREIQGTYAKVVRTEVETTGEEKRIWKKALKSLRLWHIE